MSLLHHLVEVWPVCSCLASEESLDEGPDGFATAFDLPSEVRVEVFLGEDLLEAGLEVAKVKSAERDRHFLVVVVLHTLDQLVVFVVKVAEALDLEDILLEEQTDVLGEDCLPGS